MIQTSLGIQEGYSRQAKNDDEDKQHQFSMNNVNILQHQNGQMTSKVDKQC